MLDPNIVKIQHGIRAYDLKEAIAQAFKASHPLFCRTVRPSKGFQKKYDLLLFEWFQHLPLKCWG
jgi:hypothetical protein